MSTEFLNAPGPRRNRYLLMRHGHSLANERRLIISDPRHGLDAYGLSTEGETQLARLVDAWCWPVPTRVHHSDFLRTTQTATRVAEHFGLTPCPEPRLRERHFGAFEARSADLYLRIWALDERDPSHRTHGVEPVVAVAERMQAVIASLEREVADGEDGFVGPAVRVSIFLSPLDVHVNRAPIGGLVVGTTYSSGKFIAAYKAEAGDKNERCAVHIQGEQARVTVTQIAGVVARRIVCRVSAGDKVEAGERFGMIRFGSRTDCYMPRTTEVTVRIGEHVRGGQTVIGVLK